MSPIGHCPGCDRPYTAGEVAGWGILRSRRAEQGGPTVEFACPRCDRILTLVPHGKGRYAPPGNEPPPLSPEPPVVPWATPATAPPEPAASATTPAPAPPVAEEDGPIDRAEALRILGLEEGVEDAAIQAAFAERSLLCHPDKVAHLDEDFRLLAERKFRRLRRAYELLR